MKSHNKGDKMLGFCPDQSTFENLKHGEKLLQQCDHGSVIQLHQWWQDPNMYYAFETKAGAKWLAEHGGPKQFLNMVESRLPNKKKLALEDPFKVEMLCHSCSKPFDSTKKKVMVQICRCVCGTKVTHEDCFMPDDCPMCNVKMSKILRKEDLLKINA